MQLVEGVVRVAGTVAYCDLRPWILNTTIKVFYNSLPYPCLYLSLILTFTLPCLTLPFLTRPHHTLTRLTVTLTSHRNR